MVKTLSFGLNLFIRRLYIRLNVFLLLIWSELSLISNCADKYYWKILMDPLLRGTSDATVNLHH